MFRDRLIRIPKSGPRNGAPSFAKLLKRVNSQLDSGFSFQGTIFRPGRLIAEGELRKPEYPNPPLLLECAGIFGGRGHKRGEALYILWQLDQTNWTEIARARSQAWEWSLEIGPIAQRILANTSPGVIQVLSSVLTIETRIRSALEREIEQLDITERRHVLCLLHDHIASRCALLDGSGLEG